VKDWDNVSKLWTQALERISCEASSDHPCLIIDPPDNPKTQRETLAQLAFEQSVSAFLYTLI